MLLAYQHFQPPRLLPGVLVLLCCRQCPWGGLGMSVTVCVWVTCWVIRAAWTRHGPQGSPGPALERTRRVPQGQPGLACHRHSCVTLGIKWGSGVALLVLEAGGGGLWAPGGPAHWPHTSQEVGDTPRGRWGMGCPSPKRPPPSSPENGATSSDQLYPGLRDPGTLVSCVPPELS